jgi:predicted DsbA family dithiol-disulfide isomerase
MTDKSVSICYFTDLLCVWAYVAQVRLDELRSNFPREIEVRHRFVPVFGNTAQKIGKGWAERGGYEGYSSHVRQIVEDLGHVEVHPDVWTKIIPASSHGPHLFVKAAELATDATGSTEHNGRSTLEELSWRLRVALFKELRDIGRLEIQLDVARTLDLPVDEIRGKIEDGSAYAALAEDYEEATRLQVTGSPTFVLNEGRQKLYGNVGYRIIEANIQELLRDRGETASWC